MPLCHVPSALVALWSYSLSTGKLIPASRPLGLLSSSFSSLDFCRASHSPYSPLQLLQPSPRSPHEVLKGMQRHQGYAFASSHSKLSVLELRGHLHIFPPLQWELSKYLSNWPADHFSLRCSQSLSLPALLGTWALTIYFSSLSRINGIDVSWCMHTQPAATLRTSNSPFLHSIRYLVLM